MILALLITVAACGAEASPTNASSSGAGAASGVAGQRPANAGPVDDLRAIDFVADPQGKEFTFRARANGLLLVYFGYLTCPDICPLTMVDTANGVRGLGTDSTRVEVAMATVDLERDKGDNLRNCLTHFFPEGGAHGLRTNDDVTLLNLTYRFGATFKIDPHTPGTYYGVAHTGSTYVVDAKGALIWTWPFGTTGAQITTTLRSLLPVPEPARAQADATAHSADATPTGHERPVPPSPQ